MVRKESLAMVGALCQFRKELLAIIHHIKLTKSYLSGKHFKVRTDHFSLKYLHRFKEPEG